MKARCVRRHPLSANPQRPARAQPDRPAPGAAGWTSTHSPTNSWLSNWIEIVGAARKVDQGGTEAGLASGLSGRSEACKSLSPAPTSPTTLVPSPFSPATPSGSESRPRMPHPVHRGEAELPEETGGSVLINNSRKPGCDGTLNVLQVPCVLEIFGQICTILITATDEYR